MAHHSHNTRSKGDLQSSSSQFDQNTTNSQIYYTNQSLSTDTIIASQGIKEDVDTLPPHALSQNENSNFDEATSDQNPTLEDYQDMKVWLQQQEVNMNKLLKLYDQVNNKDTKFSSIVPVTPASTIDQATKQLRSKQINQLFESTPFSGDRSQDVVDWLDEFNRKGDDINLDDIQRLSVARGLMKDDAKLWADTLKNCPIDWKTFQQKLISYFQLVAGIDCFSFSEQLYTRQQQLYESAIQYYHDIMRLCSKVDFNMTNNTRLKHLYRGLRPETKINIDIQKFHTPADFLQELGRLEQLQRDFETDVYEPYYSNDEQFQQNKQVQPRQQPRQQQYQQRQQYQQEQLQQQQHNSYVPSQSRYRSYPSKSSSQYRNQQTSSKTSTNHLNE